MANGALDPEVEAFLQAGAGAGEACERALETSISRLFFYSDRVLKLKKPVDFGFLDFTTAERRRWAARRELEFNRLTAPDVYRRVVAIRRAADGRLTVEDEGEVVDWALEMRRFDETALLSARLPLDPAFAEAVGRTVARMHAKAAPGSAGCGAAGLGYVVDSNAEQMRECTDLLDPAEAQALIAATRAALAAANPALDARAAEGFCRACHGDLHLTNIFVEAGAPVLFDCIEFSDRLREIDIAYDLAFLLMDLTFHQDPVAANRVFNGWLDEAARAFPQSNWTVAGLMPLLQAVRAGVLAHVRAREAQAEMARGYLAAAREWLAPTAPRLIAVGGLSGSGKTTRARALAPSVGPAPGAVVVRSDEIRKRRFGLEPTARLGPDGYGPEVSTAVYQELEAICGRVLRSGASVIADATFLEPERRAAIAATARAAGADFEGIWLQATPEALAERLAQRSGDASDADMDVLKAQLGRDPGPIDWRRG